MKKLVIIICLICIIFCGCSPVQREVTCDQIAAAYEEAGYQVFHKDPSGIDGYDCYIAVEDTQTGDTIYFHRFPTAAEAQSYADARGYNVLVWFFSVIYGDPSWVHTTTYGQFEIEYDAEAMYEPFSELIG